ncbi:MAG: hypothetical protein L0K27_09760 [Corynebacterium nuruki]|nr:hypothetical protein [Corynebacterium nuruki]
MARSEKIDPTPGTPRTVHHTAAVLIGAAVGVTAAPVPVVPQIIAVVLFLAAGAGVRHGHPKPRPGTPPVAASGPPPRIRVRQVLPLIPLVLALLALLRIHPANWVIAVIVWGVAAAFTWEMIPRIDGTKELGDIAATRARRDR